MSEQRKSVNCAPLWLVVFYTFMLLFFVVALGVSVTWELRDLQRRVGQLEQGR